MFFCRVKGHRNLLQYSPLPKKARVRQVALDKWFPLMGCCARLLRASPGGAPARRPSRGARRRGRWPGGRRPTAAAAAAPAHGTLPTVTFSDFRSGKEGSAPPDFEFGLPCFDLGASFELGVQVRARRLLRSHGLAAIIRLSHIISDHMILYYSIQYYVILEYSIS